MASMAAIMAAIAVMAIITIINYTCSNSYIYYALKSNSGGGFRGFVGRAMTQ
jgi:hypothetical protein